MKYGFKVSGQSLAFEPFPASHEKPWKYSQRPGGWIVLESPSGKRIRMSAVESRGRFSVHAQGRTWSGEWQKKSWGDSTAASSLEGDLTAQFPGKVRKILVSESSEVAAGDILVLVEAMKMEFSIRAPFAGKVERIHVSEGQQLSPGDRFLDLTKEKV